jgi:phosphoglycerol geranylgeranyltransferase
MTIYSQIYNLTLKRKVHMTLIDPASQNISRSTEIAIEAERAGTDFFMIGGSTSIDMKVMDDTISGIKKETTKPVIIFPGSSLMISRYADAIYFMSLLNSRNPNFIIGHQVKAAPFLKKMGIETIPMGYLVFDPGMTVGKVGEADLIDNRNEDPAIAYSLAAQMLGMKLVYLEAGSGAPVTVNPRIVKAVKSQISVPLIVGGGIRTKENASIIAKAGADVVVTGTIVEKAEKVYDALEPIIREIKSVV